jgi:hypothetical protein
MTCRGLRGAAGVTTSAGALVFEVETTLRSLLWRIGPHSPCNSTYVGGQKGGRSQ